MPRDAFSPPTNAGQQPGGRHGSGERRSSAAGRGARVGKPPAQAAAEGMQRLGQDYPTYYREVIEEYFRKLARDDAASQP